MGTVYKWDLFVQLVRDKCFIDYDGGGTILDSTGAVIGTVQCNVSWLRRFKKSHPDATHVRWVNR